MTGSRLAVLTLIAVPLFLAGTNTAWTPVDELRFATASNVTCRQMYDLWDDYGINLFVLPEIEANCRRCVVRHPEER